MALVAGLHCEQIGPPGGEAVVLSAGLGGLGDYWRPNLAALAAQQRVVLYDHRGTGRSDRSLPADHTVEQMADDMLAVMDGLEIERAHIVGHALGGLIGLALAVKAPSRVRSIVAVNAWARLDPYTARCFDARLSLLRDSGPEAFLRAQPIFLYPPAWISEHSRRLDDDLPAHLAAFPGRSAVEARIAAVRAFDVEARLGEIDTPVLCLSSEDDALAPPTAGQALARGLPAGQFHLTAHGGHACNVTHPDTFNRIVLAWLAGEALPDRS
jgi:aminoacrylate hydrolase